jgi:hypothetical protein
VVDLSSDEEDTLPDTLREEEFIRKLFGDLNHGLLGLPSDTNIIVLSDTDEEEEVREEDAVDVEVMPPSARNSSAPIVSSDDQPDGV